MSDVTSFVCHRRRWTFASTGFASTHSVQPQFKLLSWNNSIKPTTVTSTNKSSAKSRRSRLFHHHGISFVIGGCYPLRMSAKRRTTEWQKLSKGRGCYKVGITCKWSWHVFIQWGLFNYRCPSGITSLRWIEVGYRLPLLHVTVSKLIIPSWLNLGFNIPFGCGLQAKEGGIESRNSLQTSLMDNLIVIIHRHHHHNRNHCMPIVSLINQSWSPSSGFRTPFWET